MDSEPHTTIQTQPSDAAWRFPNPDEIKQELLQEFTTERKDKVWAEASEAVKTYYDQLLGRWKEEMDTLLVYAGVSSAVLTAFIVESYKLLQPDTDSTVTVLKQISSQLNSFTVTPPFVNVTRMDQPISVGNVPFRASSPAIWLNALWFSSLVFSLGSALLALFVKQWIYEAIVGGNSRESARLRQYRLNGLLRWRVGTIILILPIMLQLASVLFLVGLVVLLWTLHTAVAAIVSLLVGLLFTFFLTVTVLPVFRSDCSYRSPASSAIYVIFRHTRNIATQATRRLCRVIDRWYTALSCGVPKVSCLYGFAYNYIYMSTWRGRDHNAIHEQRGALDRAIVTTAYSTTADTKFVTEMPVIFCDLPPEQVAKCFLDIKDFMEGQWGDWGIQQGLYEHPIALLRLSYYGLRHMLARTDKGTKAWMDDIRTVNRYYCLPENEVDGHLAGRVCMTLSQLAVEYPAYRALYGSACLVLRRVYDHQEAHHSYDTLCHVKAMAERILESWAPTGFKALQGYTAAIYVLLHCLRETLSGRSQLTEAQREVLLAWGRDTIPWVTQWIRDLRWQGLHKGCVALSGDAVGALAFPHIASNYLLIDIIDPLIALCSTPGGPELISAEFISAVERTWSRAQAAYPNPIDEVQGAAFVWCSGLDSIDAKLRELRAIYAKSSK